MKKATDRKNAGFAVIFDLDGVLVDTHKYNIESYRKILGRYGIERFKDYPGRSLKDKLSLWKSEYDIPLSLRDFSRKTGEIQLDLITRNERPNKPLLKLLRDLKQNRVPLGIGTASFRWRTKKIIRLLNISRYFQTLITAEDVIKHKPASEVYLKVAKRMGIRPKRCVVIEDSLVGIQAASNCGMKTIAYVPSKHPKKEISRISDLVITDFSDLSYEKIEKMFDRE